MDDFSDIISIINCMRKLPVLLIISWFCIIPTCAKTVDNTVDSMNIQSKKGYVGTLPDVTSKFQPSIPTEATPVFEAQDGFDDPDQLKPVPRDNPAFINIILKQDKHSQYLNDIARIVPIIEQLISGIEDEISAQIFVAKADVLYLNIDALRRKYEGKPESYYISYTKLMPLGTQVKSIATLRSEAEKYNKYLAYQSTGAIYAPDNVNQQLQYLKEELENVLVILKQVN